MLYFEDQPLDLSTKTRARTESYSVPVPSGLSPIFNFTEFYKTYLEISQKSLDVYYSQQTFHHSQSPEPTKSAIRAKRKLSSEFEASESKKVRRESGEEEEKVHLSQTKLTRMMRRRKKEQLTEIGRSCDCRACYEDHIRKLRLQIDNPWPLLWSIKDIQLRRDICDSCINFCISY